MPSTPLFTAPCFADARRRAAFTLIELLTVIAIIGILSAILFAAANSVTKARHGTVCLNNLRQIGVATLLYAEEHRGSFPPAISSPPAVTNPFSPWNAAISRYLGIASDTTPSPLFKCPADPRDYEVSPGRFARSYSFSATPSFNGGNSNDWMGLMQTNSVGGTFPSRTVNKLARPSKTIMVTEWWSNNAGAVRDNLQDSYNFSVLSPGWVTVPAFPIAVNGSAGEYYHGQRINAVFADGHAAAVTPTEIVGDYAATRMTLWRAIQ